MINWPTAFVIAIAMICGAFLINKPSDAAFGGGGMIVAEGDNGPFVWQLSGDKVRYCYAKGVDGAAGKREFRVFCTKYQG